MSSGRNLEGLTMGTIKTGLIKGTTSTITTTVTSAGMINGKYVTGKTALTNSAIPTTDAITGSAFVALTDNQATVFVVGQKADATVQMAQGTIVPTQIGVTTTAGDFINAPQFPVLPDDFMVWGYVLCRTAPSAGNFLVGTATTGDWDATGVTSSQFVQCGVLPDRPVTA
jgi:hypothetical protein